MTNIPCLIMQYKPYIVEQPPRKLLREMKLLYYSTQYTCIKPYMCNIQAGIQERKRAIIGALN